MHPRHFKDTKIPAGRRTPAWKPAPGTAGLIAAAFVVFSGAASQLTAEPAVILAQTTTPLRGLQGDATSRLPSAQDMLRQQQNKQLNTLSGRQSVETSERRQHLQRMHQQSKTCADPNNSACTPPPAAK